MTLTADLPGPELAAALFALLGGAHCAGMCGGFTAGLQQRRPAGISAVRFAIGYHAGRIATYTTAGILAGCLGGALFATALHPLQVLLLALGGTMLIVLGAALWAPRPASRLRFLEPLGAAFWRHLRPWLGRLMPPRSAAGAFVAGLFWGWIPCGMVYGALPLALTAGSPWHGGLVMLAFGIGTLPAMVMVDLTILGLGRQSIWRTGPTPLSRRSRVIRAGFGVLIMAFGCSDLAQAALTAGLANPDLALLAALCHHPGS